MATGDSGTISKAEKTAARNDARRMSGGTESAFAQEWRVGSIRDTDRFDGDW